MTFRIYAFTIHVHIITAINISLIFILQVITLAKSKLGVNMVMIRWNIAYATVIKCLSLGTNAIY